jgi:hypothetical protein
MDSFYSHAYLNMGNVDNSFSNSDEEMFWKMNKQHQMVSTIIVESANTLELFNTNELTLCQNVESMSRTFLWLCFHPSQKSYKTCLLWPSNFSYQNYDCITKVTNCSHLYYYYMSLINHYSQEF